ncbi:MAG: RluA family pseudouridine synthase [Candidatus Vogelbacteria bacterium]|nr:RluA family pseudouridine synthase [Candidatus Vogelbacteria bacterium]
MLTPKIIFENENVVVLNKPAGLLVHSHIGSIDKTLVDWLIKKYPTIKKVGEPRGEELRSGIVHRLDKDTSGVMIVAKNQPTYAFLKKQFASGDSARGYERRPGKAYRALVYGNVKEDQGIINRPIGRSRNDPRRRVAGPKASSNLREALTYYKVLERFDLGDERYSYVEAYPKTGRTHQVRVHLTSIGKPVLCDALYAPGKVCPLGLTRHALHAYSLEIELPQLGYKKFEAPVPDDMARALEQLRSLC